VCVWLRTPFGWKTWVSQSVNCGQRTVDVEVSQPSEFVELVHIGSLREIHVSCYSGRWIVLVHLEASWLQGCEFVPKECIGWARTHVWRLSDCKNVSSCWEIISRGPVEGFACATSLSVGVKRVFGEWLIVFSCSVLTFWNGNKLPLQIEPPVCYTMFLSTCEPSGPIFMQYGINVTLLEAVPILYFLISCSQ
jgi:hypothetical protein